MLEIITATTADIEKIREITMLTWPQTYNHIIGDKQVAYMLGLFYNSAMLEKQMEEGHYFILGSLDNETIAFASFSEISSGVFKLHKLYILPSVQGKGTGRAMTDYISSAVAELGGTELRLNVNRYNHPAKAFYDKYGFRHLADEDIDIGGGYYMNDHILVKDIFVAKKKGVQ